MKIKHLQQQPTLQEMEQHKLPALIQEITKEAPNFRSELPSKSGDDLLSHKAERSGGSLGPAAIGRT